MGDRPHLALPSRGSFSPATPSGLTPNTRTEAEAALTHNSIAQTDSAAPIISPDDQVTEAQEAYRRPAGLIRTSSTNYEKALREAHAQVSAYSDLGSNADAAEPSDITEGSKVDSPVPTMTPFPAPAQGVVPRKASISSGQATIMREAKPSGLRLGELGRQQSWSKQDMKHVMQGNLMSSADTKEEPGYGTSEGAPVGPAGY